MHLPASLLLLRASSEGGRYTGLGGHANAIQGHDQRHEVGGEGRHCSAKHRRRLACHVDGHQNGYGGARSPWRPQVVTNQKEAFAGTVRAWGCQTWHSMRRLGLDRNGARGAWPTGGRRTRLLLLCVGKRHRSSSGPAGGGHPPMAWCSHQAGPPQPTLRIPSYAVQLVS